MKDVKMCEYCNRIMTELECLKHKKVCDYNPINKRCNSCNFNTFESLPFLGTICQAGTTVADSLCQNIFINTCEKYSWPKS